MRSAYKYAGVLLLLTAVACGDDDDGVNVSTTTTYKATLTGAAEVPAVTTNATGSATVTLDAAKNLTYTVTYAGLSSGLTVGHIHGPATPGNSAPSVLGFTLTAGTTAGTIGPVTVALPTAVLTGGVSADSLIAWMNSGRAYVNLHTATNGGGEIRGWLVKQ